jgi:hypothetical protein
MKTKLPKIGLIALAFTFVIAGSSWATNKHQERKHKKSYHKRIYHGDHVKKRYNKAGHWRHGGGHWHMENMIANLKTTMQPAQLSSDEVARLAATVNSRLEKERNRKS